MVYSMPTEEKIVEGMEYIMAQVKGVETDLTPEIRIVSLGLTRYEKGLVSLLLEDLFWAWEPPMSGTIADVAKYIIDKHQKANNLNIRR